MIRRIKIQQFAINKRLFRKAFLYLHARKISVQPKAYGKYWFTPFSYRMLKGKKQSIGKREENFKAIGFMCIVLPLFGLFDHR